MSELKMGDRVRILNGGECKVLAKLGFLMKERKWL